MVGHLAWAMMCRRESLAVFSHVYRFIRQHRHDWVPLPSAVHQEIRSASALLPLQSANLRAQWAGAVQISG
eukprot:8588494-Lingulodinium_polyedra.AAC.1